MATMMRCNVARSAARPSRASAVVVRASAEPSRRVVLGLVAGAVAGALLMAPQEASAIRIPSQEFTGGLVTGGGNSPKSPTAASMESYTLEGTKKQGVSVKTKKKLLAKVREQAQKSASS
ncbi:hypothetical protein GPECTOR_3g113 [Gonium pectorale]|uniref:Uncharacterized protein n=1 Tax=Gonium pectorale TaxID=33097 RepID=A0A150GYR8_GONPE|nr:hypothetical protein GPECTOR_3g113 [Gonium pectorale]|eukprot:KXZ54944.1 hypothetical protein GPECTOR_3g113 [Gonium pectorale]